MTGAILQLQATGVQDTFLSVNPQINVFKYSYYRYVNFATETVRVPLNEAASFGKRTYAIVPKRGHLISGMYLHLRLPALQKTSGTFACWTDAIGHYLPHRIELEINGQVVDRLYNVFNDMYDELSNPKAEGTKLMVLKSTDYRSQRYNATVPNDLYIPINFWFTQQQNLALPIIAMQNQDIRVNFTFNSFDTSINYDGATPPDAVDIIESDLFVDYVYLDESVLEEFRTKEHRFLVQQVQYNGEEVIPETSTTHVADLKFNHACKEILFALVTTESSENNDHFNYSQTMNNEAMPLIKSATLLLDGTVRFDDLPEVYYRLAAPHKAHSVVPLKHLYVMPFALNCEHNQPTGSVNLSRFDQVKLNIQMQDDTPECKLYVYAINYNILTFKDGFMFFEFAT